MFKRWLFWKFTRERLYIRHLEREIHYWRAQYIHERQRAEVAIDTCRVQHAHTGPVTVPPRLETETVLREVNEMMTQPEFGQVGQP